MILIIVLNLWFYFQWDGTGCKGWYWEEEYVTHVQKSLQEEAANEAVSQQTKPMNVEQTNDMSFVLVGIGREIVILLKCILCLVCLVLLGIVYVVVMLT